MNIYIYGYMGGNIVPRTFEDSDPPEASFRPRTKLEVTAW